MLGLLAWVHDLGDRTSSASRRATARGSCGGAVHRLAVGCAGPARRGADLVDDPSGAAGGAGGAAPAAEPAPELELRVLVQADRDDVGADSGAVSTPAWLAHATRTSTASCHRDLHLAAKLDEPVRPDPGRARGRRDRRGEGGHRHRRRGAADGGVRRPAGRHRGPGRGAPARAGPGLRRPHAAEAGQAAVRGGLPRGGRRRRGREAREGRGPGPRARAPLAPRQRRRHQRGTVPAAHPARAAVEEGARGAHQSAADRRGPARPRDREEAPAHHPARSRADGAAREPPERAAEPERLPVHPGGHHRRSTR